MYGFICYNPAQSVTGIKSLSQSASKPARFMALAEHHDYRSFHWCGVPVTPVTPENLCLVHDAAFVKGVFDGTIPNGFDNFDNRVANACLWTVGSMLSAARKAIEYPDTPVCSPTSGFHHAGRDFANGYCTFNGLMVTAAMLVAANPKAKIAILDCDMHYGDGTQDILQSQPTLAKQIMHHTAGKYFFGDNPAAEAVEFQAWLHEAIEDINSFKPDVVLYQAGADPHIDDPLGGFLDDADLIKRDNTVFNQIKSPIAWNLAGGYQQSKDGSIYTDPVLRIHLNTLRSAGRAARAKHDAKFKPVSAARLQCLQGAKPHD